MPREPDVSMSQFGPDATSTDVHGIINLNHRYGAGDYRERWLVATQLRTEVRRGLGINMLPPELAAAVMLGISGEAAIYSIAQRFGEATPQTLGEFALLNANPFMPQLQAELDLGNFPHPTTWRKPPRLSGLLYVPAAAALASYGFQADVRFGDAQTFDAPAEALDRDWLTDSTLQSVFGHRDPLKLVEFKQQLCRGLTLNDIAEHVNQVPPSLTDDPLGKYVHTALVAMGPDYGIAPHIQRGQHFVLVTSVIDGQVIHDDPQLSPDHATGRKMPAAAFEWWMNQRPNGILITRTATNGEYRTGRNFS